MSYFKSSLVLAAGIVLAFAVVFVGDAIVGWVGLNRDGSEPSAYVLWLAWLGILFVALDGVLRLYPKRAGALLVGLGCTGSFLLSGVIFGSVAICTTWTPFGSAAWWNDCGAQWMYVNPLGLVVCALLVVGAFVVNRDLHRQPPSHQRPAAV